MRRVRILSDGHANGTRVVDAETGQALPFVVALSVEAEVGAPVIARVTQLYRVDELDMEADLAERSVVPPARIDAHVHTPEHRGQTLGSCPC